MQFISSRSRVLRYFPIVTCLLLLSFKAFAEEEAKRMVSSENPFLKVSSNAGQLSLEAGGVTVEDIFKEISEKCSIEIRNYGKVFPPDFVNIRFSDLKLKEGIKKIIKLAGIKNYSILYKETNSGKYQIYAIDFLGEGKTSMGGKSGLEGFGKETTKKQVNRAMNKRGDFSQIDFEERLGEFKDKYQWESSDTQGLARYLLEKMPEEAREAGLEGIIKGLNKRIKEEGEGLVDEEMLLKAIEETVPPHIAPKMMHYVRKQINEYRGEEIYETNEIPEKPLNEAK